MSGKIAPELSEFNTAATAARSRISAFSGTSRPLEVQRLNLVALPIRHFAVGKVTTEVIGGLVTPENIPLRVPGDQGRATNPVCSAFQCGRNLSGRIDKVKGRRTGLRGD
jgi:hypothetical protein